MQRKISLLYFIILQFYKLFKVILTPNSYSFLLYRFETRIDSFHITGLPDNSRKPHLLSSLDDMSLFQITFETNPLDETVAQRCIIEAEPLEIIYDAVSIFCLTKLQCIFSCFEFVFYVGGAYFNRGQSIV